MDLQTSQGHLVALKVPVMEIGDTPLGTEG